MLGLGEGTIRSILDILKEKDLLVSDKQGHSLSANGNSVVRKIKNYIEIGKVNLDSIYQGKKNIAIHIKNPKKIEKAVELRDTAVKNGADGALILESIDSDTEHNFNEIENKFDLSKDDMVIVAYADSYMLAEHGALAVAIELCDEIKNIMQGFK
jgi:predicted nucleic acid-binding protein